ncbi:unnamed protein product [Rhizoctonia solani]|uniref:Uncharacterized protein n=1 Tax=Rhizoctonia solani TaxID=456999 RepID=A0A8H3HUQ0_9AGAM|nr:unnamed protein product [Rhizoctonia solani]
MAGYYNNRFKRLDELGDLEQAIMHASHALALTPDDHPDLPRYLSILAVSYSDRVKRLGDLGDLEQAIKCQSRALYLTPDDHPDLSIRLTNLAVSHSDRFRRLGEMRDLDQAIDYQSRALGLTADDHPALLKRLANLAVFYDDRFERLGSRVGAQASVPHEDLASLTALLSVWTSLGGSVGSAVATAIWTSTMPDNLDKYLPGVPQATITKLYGSIKSARNASPEVRKGVIEAYGATTRPMFIISLGLSCICFILAFFMPNYYLGKTQNAVDGKDLAGEVVNTTAGESRRGEEKKRNESN